MKQGGLYVRQAPDAPAELVERTRSADEQNTPEGRSGTAREAPGTDSGSEGLAQDSEGLQATAPNPEQAPAADAGRTEPSAPAPSTRTRKGG
jgi:hypothetical protein